MQVPTVMSKNEWSWKVETAVVCVAAFHQLHQYINLLRQDNKTFISRTLACLNAEYNSSLMQLHHSAT
jgi:hypothetical protein